MNVDRVESYKETICVQSLSRNYYYSYVAALCVNADDLCLKPTSEYYGYPKVFCDLFEIQEKCPVYCGLCDTTSASTNDAVTTPAPATQSTMSTSEKAGKDKPTKQSLLPLKFASS